MGKIRYALMASAMLAFVPGAMAADVAPPVTSWTGVYLGIGVGGNYSFADTQAGGYGYYDDYISEDYCGPLCYDTFTLDNGDLGIGWENYGGYGPGIVSSAVASEDNEYYFGGAAVAGLGNINNLTSAINSVFDNGEAPLSGSGADLGKAGFFGRGEIGADYQVDSFVMGLNAGFNIGKRNLKATGGGVGSAYGDLYELGDQENHFGEGGGAAAVSTDLELGNSWSIGARAGWLATERTLVFLSGGYAATKADLNASFNGQIGTDTFGSDEDGYTDSGSFNASLSQSASNSDWLNGFYVGGGFETLLTDYISWKMEYRYTDLGSISTSSSESGTWDGPGLCDGPCTYGYGVGVAAKADVTEHAVFTTLSWRFGL